jgi:tetratricopeptide (TPR) repeat protein
LKVAPDLLLNEMKNHHSLPLILTSLVWNCLPGNLPIGTSAAFADAISPGIRDSGEVYSSEPPETSYYGTGEAGRLSEASALRFSGDQLFHEGKYDQSIEKLSKALQLDPGDPDGHILYARSLSAKIKRSKTVPDGVLVNRAIDEWKLIWHHDADAVDQAEAKAQAKYLVRLAKSISKLQTQVAENNSQKQAVAAQHIDQLK